MSFYLQYGAYATDPCTVRATSHNVTPVMYNGFAVAFKRSIGIEGYLYGNGTADLLAKMAAMEAALTLPNQSGGIKYSGGNTQHWLTSVGAIGGVQLENFNWVDSPLHMVSEAKFQLTLSAEYGNALEPQDVVQWDESVEIIGEGGADTPLATQVGAPSVRQTIADYTDVVVTQSGFVIGRTGYPALPNPLIVTAGARQVRQTRDLKSRVQIRKGIMVYKRAYSYTFTLPSHPGNVNPGVLV